MAYLLSKVIINDVTIRDDTNPPDNNYLVGWEYERSGTNEISQLSLNVLKSITNDITLSTGQRIEIWKGFTTSTDTKVFDGYISSYEPNGGLIVIEGYDKLWDLIRKNVNKVYEISGPQVGQISEIAKDLIEVYGGLNADVVATCLGDTETIDEFRCVHTKLLIFQKYLYGHI